MDVKLFDSELKVMDVLWKRGDTPAKEIAKVLTAQLRDMEAKGLLTRTVYAEVPPRVEYTLTETGYSLRPILDSMVAWGTDYQRKNGGGR